MPVTTQSGSQTFRFEGYQAIAAAPRSMEGSEGELYDIEILCLLTSRCRVQNGCLSGQGVK